MARAFAHAGKVDAVLCLGAVIRGDTGHYDFVAGECASGIQQVQLATGVPVVFGVLTTDTLEQALVRSRARPHQQGPGGGADRHRDGAPAAQRPALLDGAPTRPALRPAFIGQFTGSTLPGHVRCRTRGRSGRPEQRRRTRTEHGRSAWRRADEAEQATWRRRRRAGLGRGAGRRSGRRPRPDDAVRLSGRPGRDPLPARRPTRGRLHACSTSPSTATGGPMSRQVRARRSC